MFSIFRAFRRDPWWYANYLRTFVWIGLFLCLWFGSRNKSADAGASRSMQPGGFLNDSVFDGEAPSTLSCFNRSGGDLCYLSENKYQSVEYFLNNPPLVFKSEVCSTNEAPANLPPASSEPKNTNYLRLFVEMNLDEWATTLFTLLMAYVTQKLEDREKNSRKEAVQEDSDSDDGEYLQYLEDDDD